MDTECIERATDYGNTTSKLRVLLTECGITLRAEGVRESWYSENILNDGNIAAAIGGEILAALKEASGNYRQGTGAQTDYVISEITIESRAHSF